MTAPRVGFTILIESGVLLPGLRTPERKSRLLYRSRQGAMVQRKSEIHLERQWELYRRSVVEGMPDSDYKAAVLAGLSYPGGERVPLPTVGYR